MNARSRHSGERDEINKCKGTNYREIGAERVTTVGISSNFFVDSIKNHKLCSLTNKGDVAINQTKTGVKKDDGDNEESHEEITIYNVTNNNSSSSTTFTENFKPNNHDTHNRKNTVNTYNRKRDHTSDNGNNNCSNSTSTSNNYVDNNSNGDSSNSDSVTSLETVIEQKGDYCDRQKEKVFHQTTYRGETHFFSSRVVSVSDASNSSSNTGDFLNPYGELF